VKYPETILNDSDYESDNEVVNNPAYKADIKKYIVKNDERKREVIESQGQPKRIHAARTARGHNNFKDLAQYIYHKALDVGLANQGLSKEMTKERRFGNHLVKENMSRKSTYQKGVEEELARQIAAYVKEKPSCFVQDVLARDKLLSRF